MIILFLDFDGVLHGIGKQVFEPECVNLVADTVEPYDVKIVIASSWREVHGLDYLRDFVGPRLGDRLIGVTPVINEPFLKYCRHAECLKYLEENDLTNTPWVAIDDEKGCYPPEAPVVLTNYRNGFGAGDAERLDQLLRDAATGKRLR